MSSFYKIDFTQPIEGVNGVAATVVDGPAYCLEMKDQVWSIKCGDRLYKVNQSGQCASRGPQLFRQVEPRNPEIAAAAERQTQQAVGRGSFGICDAVDPLLKGIL